MRGVLLTTLAATALGSCAMDGRPVPVQPVAGAQTIAFLLAGKVATAPIRCLSTYQRNDMVVLDSQTVAYRDGGSRTFVMHLSPGCGEIAHGGALITRSFGTSDLCTGDIAQAAVGPQPFIGGSCSIGEIVPYVKPRG
ncbi:MAG: hypothetical protein ABIW33_02880 [Sphingomicrobium sp.]